MQAQTDGGQGPEDPTSCDLDSHILGELAGEIQSERASDRLHAVSVLGRFGTGPGSLEALKLLTSDDPDPDVRRQARGAYERLKSRVGEPLSHELALRDGSSPPRLSLERFRELLGVPNPIYRIEAILQAVAVGDKAGLGPILERLERENDEWVIATLVRAIGKLGEKKHAEIVHPFLEWEDQPRIVANAIEALSELDVQRYAKEIVHHVESKDPRVQAAAVVALYPIEREAARVCLMAMSHAGKAARYAAAHCMARLHDPECVAMLKKMAAEERDPELKQRLNEQLQLTGRML